MGDGIPVIGEVFETVLDLRFRGEVLAEHVPKGVNDLQVVHHVAEVEFVPIGVDRYLEANRIVEKDTLIGEAFACLETPSKPAKELLEWDELSNRRTDWHGRHTRTANHWAEDRPIPLITTSSSPDQGTEWKWTVFGEFVRWLSSTDLSRRDIKEDGFPTAAPSETVNSVLDEFTQVDSDALSAWDSPS